MELKKMTRLRTVKLKNTNGLTRGMYGDEGVAWACIKNGGVVGYDTTCKEELGQQAVDKQLFEFAVMCPERLDKEEIIKLEEQLNKRCKKLKVAGVKLARIEGYRKWIYLKHSPRWSRNSVAHSYLTTIVRKTICEMTEQETYQDDEHLRDAQAVVKIIEKKGLRVFGTKQHTRYDVGMVSFATHLQNGFGKGKLCSEPEPKREDYDNDNRFYTALDEWEMANGGYDDYGYGYGDLDKDIPSDNAYQMLANIFNGVK